MYLSRSNMLTGWCLVGLCRCSQVRCRVSCMYWSSACLGTDVCNWRGFFIWRLLEAPVSVWHCWQVCTSMVRSTLHMRLSIPVDSRPPLGLCYSATTIAHVGCILRGETWPETHGACPFNDLRNSFCRNLVPMKWKILQTLALFGNNLAISRCRIYLTMHSLPLATRKSGLSCWEDLKVPVVACFLMFSRFQVPAVIKKIL